jgi:predicted GNAT superfamily acetyltransferase
MMEPSDLTIRRAETPADYRALQEAQRLAWGLADESYVVPIATMVGAQHHGGLVLGAFDAQGAAAGLSFAFLGRSGDRWCLYSQLTGVVPGRQGQGIGARMKAVQRDHAREIGVSHVAWAFDPLQAGNAAFNLRRLGASAGRYLEDMYGPRTDALNAGVPTDRLIAEWPVDPPPALGISDADLLALPRVLEGPDEPVIADVDAADFLVEIPADVAALRSSDPARAERWRSGMAWVLVEAFADGYRAEDVVRDGSRAFYVVRR